MHKVFDSCKAVIQEVRKSIVRICFDWKDNGVMVIPGVILSVDDGGATIAANSTFFKMKCKCVVNFPNATGYEEGLDLPYDLVVDGEDFCTFTLRPIEDGYIQPVKFETQPVNQTDRVNAFVFPRESFITPTAYCGGSIIHASTRVLIHGCPMHSYGYLGSPLFNLRGDLVGIAYDNGRAWTVCHLQYDVLENRNCTLVSNGVPVGAPPISKAQVEE